MAQKLTQKQEDFCLAYIETGNATEAYRRAYKPKTSNQNTLCRTAKGLLDNPKIAARIEELRAPVIKKAQITLDSHLSTLEELRDLAKVSGQYSAATKAEELRGKASGLYTEKIHHSGEITLKEMSDEDLDRRIMTLLPHKG